MSDSSSLRSPSPRRSRLPSPLQIFLAAFLTRGLREIPIVELVVAYLDVRGKDLRPTVAEAWGALGVLEAMRVLDLLDAGVCDDAEGALCPSPEDLEALARGEEVPASDRGESAGLLSVPELVRGLREFVSRFADWERKTL